MGIFLAFRSDLQPAMQLAVIGILPIWFEVLASRITRVEPAREIRKSWRQIDFVTDLLSFVIFPPILFLYLTPANPILNLGVFIFVAAGLTRLIRFLRRGLEDGSFAGLPVTYTGYLWAPLYGLSFWNLWVSFFVLVAISLLMVYENLKIKTSL